MHSRQITIAIAVLLAAVALVVVAALIKRPSARIEHPSTLAQNNSLAGDEHNAANGTGKKGSVSKGHGAGAASGVEGSADGAASGVKLGPDGKPLPGSGPSGNGKVTTTGGKDGKGGTGPGGASAGATGPGAGAGANGIAVGKTGKGAKDGTGKTSDATDSTGSSDSSTESTSGSGVGESTGSPTPTPAPGQALVGGTVRKGEEPVKGARLVIRGTPGSFNATSNDDGYYQFPALAAGDYIITLLDPPSQKSTRAIQLVEDDRRLDQDFVIISSDKPISGTVKEQGTGLAINNAQIIIGTTSNRWVNEVRSNVEGAYATPPINPGEYILQVNADGYQQKKQSLSFSADDDNPVVHITLDPANQVRGTVVDAGGAPLGGVSVALFGPSSGGGDPLASTGAVLTNARGEYTFATVPPVSSLRVGLWKKGLATVFSDWYTLADATKQPIPPLTMTPGIVAVGRIIDGEQKPVPDVLIAVSTRTSFPVTGNIFPRLNVPLPQTRSGADGTFRLTGLEAGTTDLDFTVEDLVPQKKSVAVAPPEVNLGDIVMSSSGGPGTIYGIVLDELGVFFPRSNITLTCANCSSPVTQYQNSDELGHFVFSNLPDGQYRVDIATSTIRDDNVWIVMKQRVTGLQPGGNQVNAVFDLSGKVNVKVTDASGQAIQRFRIDVVSRASLSTGDWMECGYGYTYERATGEATVKNLVSGGTVDLVIKVEGVGTQEVRGVVVPAGGEVGDAGTVKIGQGATLTGRIVVEGTSQGIAGATVRVAAPPGAPADNVLNRLEPTVSDEQGRFRFTGLPAGPLRVYAGAAAANYVEREFPGNSGTFTTKEATPLDVGELGLAQGGSVRGTVKDENGRAAANVIIWIGRVSGITDAQGHFHINGVPVGEQVVDARDATGKRTTQNVTVLAGQTAEVQIALGSSGSGT